MSEEPKPDERRRDPRFPITRSFLIKFGDVEKLRRTYVRDISKGGMFVRSRSPQPKGTRVRVVIGLPDGSRFPLEGEVVDVRERADGSGGNGIRFVELDDARLAMLESYIDASAAGVPQPILGDDSDVSLVNVIDPESQRKLRSKVSGAARRAPVSGLPRLGAAEPPAPDLVLRLDRSLRLLEPLPSSDPYEVLGLEPHASAADITEVLARRLQELAHDPTEGSLPMRLSARIDQARGKLNLAAETLLDPSTRAVQDLALGALLPACPDPAVSKAFEVELKRRREGASAAERAEFELAIPILELAGEKRSGGDLKAARSLYRAALIYDPHNLQIREVAAQVRAELAERAPASLTPPPMPAVARHAPHTVPPPAPPPPPAAAPAAPTAVEQESEPITMEVEPEPSEAMSLADAMEPSRDPSASSSSGLDEVEGSRPRSKLPMIIGVGLLAAAAAVGILVAGGGGSESAADAVGRADAPVTAPVTAPDPSATPEHVAAEPEPEPEPEPVAMEDDESGVPEGADEAPLAEPDVEPTEAAPSPPPDGPFADAQRAYDAGDYQRAYELADAAGGKTNERFSIMTLSQCHLDDGAVAREAFRKLVGRNTRSEVAAKCAELNLNVFAKGSGYTAGELLRKATRARDAGDKEEACKLADRSNRKSSSAQAMEILGVCACEAGSKTRARHFLKYLADENDAPIIAACAAAGIEL